MDKIDEKWYAEDGSEIKRVLRIVTIILIVAMAAWGVGLWMNERHVPQLPGEVILKGNMRFEEAEGKLLDDGYIPRGEAIKDGADIHRYYESSEAFGYQARGSMLALIQSRGRYFIFDHYFREEDGGHNAENPGDIFNALQEQLTGIIGTAPREQKSDVFGKVWIWNLQGKTEIGIFYGREDMVTVRYAYIR